MIVKPVNFDVLSHTCPARLILEHVTSRWGVLVFHALLEGTHRFSELRRKLNGVSEKMLTQTLRTLEQDGFVHRHAYPEIPPRVEYQLTELGRGAALLIKQLVVWIEDKAAEVLSHQTLKDKQQGRSLK